MNACAIIPVIKKITRVYTNKFANAIKHFTIHAGLLEQPN